MSTSGELALLLDDGLAEAIQLLTANLESTSNGFHTPAPDSVSVSNFLEVANP